LGVIGCVPGEGDTTVSGEFTPADASRLLTSYVSALATGDSAVIRPFWSERSVAREGFWFMHAWTGMRFELVQWHEFLRRHDLHVTEVSPGPHYHSIAVEWIEKNPADPAQQSPKRMVYYVVPQGDGWVLENPIDVLTRDWLTHDTECFVFRYPPNIDIRDHTAELRFMDQECSWALEMLQLDLPEKIEFYKARTPQECGDLLLQPPAYGYATRGYPYLGGAPRGYRVVVSTSFLHPHELMHLLHVEARIPSTTVVFSEGLAVALGGGAAFAAEYALVESRNLMSAADRVSLRELLTLPDAEFFTKNYETYPLAGGFIRFLLERFSIESLTRLAVETQSADQFQHTIPLVYGHDIDELDSLWQRYLLDINTPAVGFAIPATAELVFSMEDPVRDDAGDGDYSAPERFDDGVFDLTNFAVFKDETSVYFRMGFHKVAAPVSYRDGGEQFVPGVVIAVSRAASENGHSQNTAHGVRFADGIGYDFKVNVGTQVSITDNFGRVYFTTPDVWDQLADKGSGTIEFSLPSQLIGEVAAGWRYFVGVGLASERAMNFIHGGPAPVYREHPVFLSGGNYDYGNPAFIDVLMPGDHNQVEILSDYDGPAGRLAVVPMVGAQ
jgi:hypothetical protein